MSQFPGWCSTLPYTTVPREPMLCFQVIGKLCQLEWAGTTCAIVRQWQLWSLLGSHKRAIGPNLTSPRCPFQKKVGMCKAHPCKMVGALCAPTCLGRAAWCQGDAWTRSIYFVLQPQAKSASPWSHEQVTGKALALICSHGPVQNLARRGHCKFWCRKLGRNCSPSLLRGKQSELNHCFQDTSSISVAFSKQLYATINSVNIFK